MPFNKNHGVYEIVNTTNGKRYIGSSVNLKHRELCHFNELQNNTHANSHLQNSFNKHGIGSFKFNVLANCDKSEVRILEQFMMDLIVPEYNICPIAKDCTGRKFTIETRKQMSDNMKNKPLHPALLKQQQIKLPVQDGHKWCSTCKTLKPVQLVAKSRNLCKDCYDCHKKSRAVPGKRRQYAVSKGIKVLAVNSDTEIVFFSMRDAARFIGNKCNKSGIRNAISKCTEYYGFKWSKI